MKKYKKEEIVWMIIEEVISWFESALKGNMPYINLYYLPNNKALQRLIHNNVIKKAKIGKIEVGYIYKGHLFNIMAGSGDCEERLIDMGEI